MTFVWRLFILFIFFFFFNDTATTEIYTLSLHDALPISGSARLELESQGSRGVQELKTPADKRCQPSATSAGFRIAKRRLGLRRALLTMNTASMLKHFDRLRHGAEHHGAGAGATHDDTGRGKSAEGGRVRDRPGCVLVPV